MRPSIEPSMWQITRGRRDSGVVIDPPSPSVARYSATTSLARAARRAPSSPRAASQLFREQAPEPFTGAAPVGARVPLLQRDLFRVLQVLQKRALQLAGELFIENAEYVLQVQL